MEAGIVSSAAGDMAQREPRLREITRDPGDQSGPGAVQNRILPDAKLKGKLD
jgi:hypothetical protein